MIRCGEDHRSFCYVVVEMQRFYGFWTTSVHAYARKLSNFALPTSVARASKFLHLNEALTSLENQDGEPDLAKVSEVVQECIRLAALPQGRRVHACIGRSKFQNDRYLKNLLVTMYGSCGHLEDARNTFDTISKPNVFSWNALISTYTRHGLSAECIQLFQQMLQKGFEPDNFTFTSVLHACGDRADLAEGKHVHNLVAESRFVAHPFVRSALVYMYGRCGSLHDVRAIFDSSPKQHICLCNAMIEAYSHNGKNKLAILFYNKIQEEGLKPNRVTFVKVLSALSSIEDIPLGRSIHSQILDVGLDSDLLVSTALVNMYCRCGQIEDAEALFGELPERDVVPYNIMISAYSQTGNARKAWSLFQQMQREGIEPNKSTFISLTTACADLEFLKTGEQVHQYVCKAGFEVDVFVGSSLLHMYSNCGSLDNAYQVFQKSPKRDVVLWNAMITALNGHGKYVSAYQLFGQLQLEGVKPDKFTIVSILDVCANQIDLTLGTLIHASLIDRVFEYDVRISNALITMYGKCGSLKEASRVFGSMPVQDIISWNTMISTHVQHEECEVAVALYKRMLDLKIKPNKVTFLGVIGACARLMDFKTGTVLHSHAIENGFELDSGVATALVTMYCKCGSLKNAWSMFNRVPQKDVVMWSAIIAAYSQHGHGNEALDLFEQMKCEGCKPDAVTFISVLSACSHAGLIDKALSYFDCMSTDYGITPTIEHYGCVIDMFGRAGRLCEAEKWMLNLPFVPSHEIWTTFLGSCRVYGDLVREKHAASRMLELDFSRYSP